MLKVNERLKVSKKRLRISDRESKAIKEELKTGKEKLKINDEGSTISEERSKTGEVKGDLQNWMEENTQEFYEAAEAIWDTPELSMQEYQSSGILIALLRKHGFAVEEGAGGMPTAFVADFGSGSPVIGINAEYDALPGLSQKGDQSERDALKEGGPGHGCGHNLLGTAAVKAAVGLKRIMEERGIPGTVKVFGAPAEELCLGKPLLGKAGYFKGVDAFLDWHPWSYNRADYDSCNAYFNVKYHFKGRAAHGNSPWHGRSALDAAVLQGHAVELLREHLPPGCPPDAANTINYTFSDTGPEFPSVVPDKATSWYVGRFTTTEDAQDALKRVTDCAKGAALATGTEVEVELIAATHHKIPNKALAKVVHDNFQEVGPPVFTLQEQELAREIQRQLQVAPTGLATEIRPFSGGNTVVCDTSEYSWNAPYATVWVTMGPENTGWHNWGVTRCAAGSLGKKALEKGALVIGLSCLDLLLRPDLLKEAQAEFAERLEGRTYQCLLPDDYRIPIEMNRDIMEKYR